MKRSPVAALAAVLSISAGAAASQENFGSWKIDKRTDAMTDKVTVRAILEAGNNAGLSVDCEIGRPGYRVMFIFLPFLGEGQRLVYYRFDEQPAVQEIWSYTDQAAMLRDGKQADTFVAKLLIAKRLRFQGVRYDFAPANADFDITGVSDAVANIAEKCKTGK